MPGKEQVFQSLKLTAVLHIPHDPGNYAREGAIHAARLAGAVVA